MWDGSAIELDENLEIAAGAAGEGRGGARSSSRSRSASSAARRTASPHEINEKLYTDPGRLRARPPRRSALGEKGVYLLAATFGNVHGVYKPGNVKLRPDDPEAGPGASSPRARPRPSDKPFDLVFHGGSGSTLDEIREAIAYGVVKMNVDTDTQYAFTRPIAGHMFTNYDGVLKVDGEVGNKKAYDPRTYLKAAETGMAERVVRGLRGPAVRPASRRRAEHDRTRHAGPARRRRPPCCPRTRRPTLSSPRAPTGRGRRRTTRRSARPGRRWPRRRWRPSGARDTVEAYAYARTGYHRGLDALRRNGWKGFGPGAVVARAQPRLPALRCRARPGRRGDRRGRRAGALHRVAARLRPVPRRLTVIPDEICTLVTISR